MSVSDSLLTEWEERLRHAVRAQLHDTSPQAQQRYLAWLQVVVQRLERDHSMGENLLAVFAEAAVAERPTEVVLTESGGPVWTGEAEQRLRRIPFFVRPIARRSIERYAQELGIREITPAVMDQIRGHIGF
jgi:hypothetical protein